MLRQTCPAQWTGSQVDSAADGTRGVTDPAVVSRLGGPMANAMTVDVEDYFQVWAFSDRIHRRDWDDYPCRIEQNVDVVLELFDEHAIHATFFTLGWVGERYPQVVRRIVSAGHELASHGQFHVRVHEQSPEEFRTDVRGAKRSLEDLAGAPIKGYRAASFSMGQRTPWAFEVLAEEGYVYSSSIYPIRHDIYGMPEAPRYAFRPSAGCDLLEIPVSTLRILNRNFPCGGGGYFRLMPYPLARWAMRRVNRTDGLPCVFFFHPWEIDPEQPRIPGVSLKTRTRHYLNLRKMKPRLRRLLSDFTWDRMDTIFLEEEAG